MPWTSSDVSAVPLPIGNVTTTSLVIVMVCLSSTCFGFRSAVPGRQGRRVDLDGVGLAEYVVAWAASGIENEPFLSDTAVPTTLPVSSSTVILTPEHRLRTA